MAPRRYVTPEPSAYSCAGTACAGCCSGDGAVRGTVALGLTLGLSFLLLVIAGAVYHDFLPFTNIAFVVLLPIAVILGDMMKAPKYLSRGVDERSSAWANFGACFMGVLLISMFALPLVLLHVRQLTTPGFALWMASTVISSASAIAFWFARHKATAADDGGGGF